MDTETRIYPENLQEEVDLLWQAACQILGVGPDEVTMPKVFFVSPLLAERGAKCEVGGKAVGIVPGIYRGQLAHELGHAIAYQHHKFADQQDYEYIGKDVEEGIARI